MKSSVWTLGIATWLSAATVVAQGNGTGTDSSTAALSESSAASVCSQERKRYDDSRQRYLDKHPAIEATKVRAAAACLPAPSGDCALARADLAEARHRYLERHPAIVERATRAEILCAPAPTLACARARAAAALARGKYLEKHPQVLATNLAEKRECDSVPAAPTQADPSKPKH